MKEFPASPSTYTEISMQKELPEKKKEFLILKHNSPPKGDDKIERIFKNIEKNIKTENMRKRKKT